MRPVVLGVACLAVLISGCSKDKAEHEAAAPAEPLRKPGLWSIEVVTADGSPAGLTTSSQICLDAATDKRVGLAGGRLDPAAVCTQAAAKAGEGWAVKRTCKLDEQTITTEGAVSGDLEQEYTVETVTHLDPPAGGLSEKSEASITGRWLSDCGDDQKPGDVTLANGVTYNITKGGAPRP